VNWREMLFKLNGMNVTETPDEMPTSEKNFDAESNTRSQT
jgi:hypothetical protein